MNLISSNRLTINLRVNLVRALKEKKKKNCANKQNHVIEG